MRTRTKALAVVMIIVIAFATNFYILPGLTDPARERDRSQDQDRLQTCDANCECDCEYQYQHRRGDYDECPCEGSKWQGGVGTRSRKSRGCGGFRLNGRGEGRGLKRGW